MSEGKSIIGTCPECGAVMAATCETDVRQRSKSVAAMVRVGLTISTHETAAVRDMKWGHVDLCPLKPRKKQAAGKLFGDA